MLSLLTGKVAAPDVGALLAGASTDGDGCVLAGEVAAADVVSIAFPAMLFY